VLYFVSTTVNPILYNVLSRKYRQAFTMTLCNSCMDDATRQRLQRDGFAGTYSVYQSQHASAAARPPSNNPPATSNSSAGGDLTAPAAAASSKRCHRTWDGAAGVGRSTNLLPTAESGTNG